MDPANRIIVSVGLRGFASSSSLVSSLGSAVIVPYEWESGGGDNPSLVHRAQTLALCDALQNVLSFDRASIEAATPQIKALAYAFILEHPNNFGSAAYLEFSFPVRQSELAKDDQSYFNSKIVVIVRTLAKAFEAAGLNQSLLRFSLTVVD